jgi:sugar lactone lactonase YvrE
MDHSGDITQVEAQFNKPFGVAVYQEDLFIADSGNYRVFWIGVDGSTADVAGNGTPRFSGDGGPAVNASLCMPLTMLDVSGDLYIPDTCNDRIRLVDASSGTISTLVDLDAGLYSPMGLAVDGSGNLLIADTVNDRIVMLDHEGNISTVVGEGLHSPMGMAIDTFGNLFIADFNHHRVLKLDGAGVLSTVAGGLKYPVDVALDASDTLFIADTYNNRILKVTDDGAIPVAGNGSHGFSGDSGPATSAQLFNPMGVTVDQAGNLYIADTLNYRVRMVDQEGIITTIAGDGTPGFSGDGGPATSARFGWPGLGSPTGVTMSAAGNLIIADQANNRIRRVVLPAGALQSLIEEVLSMNLQKGIENSLDAKLSAASRALGD